MNIPAAITIFLLHKNVSINFLSYIATYTHNNILHTQSITIRFRECELLYLILTPAQNVGESATSFPGLLNFIKGKVEQSREWSSALPYILV